MHSTQQHSMQVTDHYSHSNQTYRLGIRTMTQLTERLCIQFQTQVIKSVHSKPLLEESARCKTSISMCHCGAEIMEMNRVSSGMHYSVKMQ